MTFDDWKPHNPDEDPCQFCGADPREGRSGWEPLNCNGKCGIVWRDPDFERDRRIDDKLTGDE